MNNEGKEKSGRKNISLATVRSLYTPDIGNNVLIEYTAERKNTKYIGIVAGVYPDYILVRNIKTGSKETFLKSQIFTNEVSITKVEPGTVIEIEEETIDESNYNFKEVDDIEEDVNIDEDLNIDDIQDIECIDDIEI